MKYWELQAQIGRAVAETEQRHGQALYNILKLAEIPGLDSIHGTLDDPFYRIKTMSSTKQWMARHLRLAEDSTIIEVVR